MENENIVTETKEERINSYKEMMRKSKIEFQAKQKALNIERKKFLKEMKEQIREVKRMEKKPSLTPEEKAELKKRKAELISERRKELLLPVYTQGEELMNAISHIVGGAFGIVALVLGIVYAYPDPKAVSCMVVFGLSIIFLYTVSSIYHFLNVNKAKKVFQILDHCTIYILIAGTYVPVCVLSLANTFFPGAYYVLGTVIFLSVLGVVLNATMMKKWAVKVISNVLYLVIGWLIIFFYPWLLEACGAVAVALFIAGGASYSIGAILYGIGRFRRYFHFIFHIFCLAGTILQFAGVLVCLI